MGRPRAHRVYDLIYHEDEEHWARDIYYGHDSYWWLDAETRKDWGRWFLIRSEAEAKDAQQSLRVRAHCAPDSQSAMHFVRGSSEALGVTVKYFDGSPIALGDKVTLPVPSGTAKARVVMLGETYEHLEIDPGFISWVKKDRVLEPGSVVVEWLDSNPFAHTDPKYAPVGNFMFSPVDEFLKRDA